MTISIDRLWNQSEITCKKCAGKVSINAEFKHWPGHSCARREVGMLFKWITGPCPRIQRKLDRIAKQIPVQEALQ